jgi:hypothetical protein
MERRMVFGKKDGVWKNGIGRNMVKIYCERKNISFYIKDIWQYRCQNGFTIII